MEMCNRLSQVAGFCIIVWSSLEQIFVLLCTVNTHRWELMKPVGNNGWSDTFWVTLTRLWPQLFLKCFILLKLTMVTFKSHDPYWQHQWGQAEPVWWNWPQLANPSGNQGKDLCCIKWRVILQVWWLMCSFHWKRCKSCTSQNAYKTWRFKCWFRWL